MGLISRIKKHYAKKALVRQLPRALKKRYGKHRKYTKDQVTSSMRSCGMNMAYCDYALAMFVSRQEFEVYARNNEVFGDYDSLRGEIADSYFDGDSGFTIHDAFDASSSTGGFFDSGGDGGDFSGGGDSDGGGGGD